MSGSPEEIVRSTLSHLLNSNEKKLLHAIMWFLLHEQYVESDPFHDRVSRILRGIGMGLPRSGFVLLYRMNESVCQMAA